MRHRGEHGTGAVRWSQDTFDMWGPPPKPPAELRAELNAIDEQLEDIECLGEAWQDCRILARDAHERLVELEAQGAPPAWCRPDCARTIRGELVSCTCDRYIDYRRKARLVQSLISITKTRLLEACAFDAREKRA